MTPQEYKTSLHEETKRAFALADKARKYGFDPSDTVEIQIAQNMAERVVGLVSVMAPQIIGSGITERIIELEKQYGSLDWRVSLQIALEVAQEKFCTFKDQKEAMEIGVRIGFAYATVGVVSSPLEGFVNIELKDRMDKAGKYFCLNFSGPIRNAGGTAAAQCVVIADYVRKHMGYAVYDPTPEEIARCHIECDDYHERVTNLQYKPSKEENDFMVKYLPVEISGDPSEKIDVSNYKNLPRIPTNKIRSGYCLIHSSCIPLKAPKLWKQLGKWGKDFGMEHWAFLEEFMKLQKQMQAHGKKASSSETKITPNYTYISDLVAGRPVFGHPLRAGAFRLRYGRARTSGLSAQCVHPATMHAMRNFIASATQLKVERPGKAAAFTVCDSIEGPIVKLTSGEVLRLDTEEQAKQVKKEIAEVLFCGDVLICYGDFANRNHPLVPAGYCEEWWALELQKKITEQNASIEDLSEQTNTDIAALLKNPFQSVSFTVAAHLTEKLDVPLHPKHTFYWSLITKEQLVDLLIWLTKANLQVRGNRLEKIVLPQGTEKVILEELGVPHKVTPDHVVIEDASLALVFQLGVQTIADIEMLLESLERSTEKPLDILKKRVPLRDKGGTFIGSRMGRPEKAKMRKLASTPHALIPVAEQGGRLRSLQSCMEKGFILAQAELYVCSHCKREGMFRRCLCGQLAEKAWFHPVLGVVTKEKLPENMPKEMVTYKQVRVVVQEHMSQTLKLLKTQVYPDLIKGVRGTMGKDHASEHFIKAILRAKHDIFVNKDGTVRYDASEVPLTHFKPHEVRASIAKLLTLGYTHDIHGAPLTDTNQVLLLKPQDIVLPSCPDSPDERCDDVLLRVTHFIDDLLVAYGEKPFYNCKTREDLVGHLVIGLAPHTSAGTVGRIVGFSNTQGLLCHPYMHCAMRRDCDGDESCVFLLMDAFLNFSKGFLPTSRGGTMDAPLVLTTVLNPAEVDDMAFDMDVATQYPLELYELALEYKMPGDVKVPQVKKLIGTPDEDIAIGYTHPVTDINAGVLCSAYKILPSMEDKLKSQMILAEQLRCVDQTDVARLVIEKHFIRDVKGNLRKFSTQQFRCVHCNKKYRRPPLKGSCVACNGKITFTISEGSVVKYLQPMESLARTYHVSPYLIQSIELTKRRVEEVFGKDSETQTGLGSWFG
jgi:DNA polymerase II large subunit